jgi:hypothetical protein
MNSTVKISAPLVHPPSAKKKTTIRRVPRVQRAEAAKIKKKSKSRGDADKLDSDDSASEDDISRAEHEAISDEAAAVAEWKLQPLKESPKAFK